MKKIIKSLIAASIALSGITFSGAVQAEQFKGPQSSVKKNAYNNDRNSGGKNWTHGKGSKNWNRGGGGNNHRRGRGRGFGNVVLGVGLGYLMFGGSSRRDRQHDSHYYSPRYVEVERAVIYRKGPTYRETVNNAQRNKFESADCLQVREYQTIIIIGGEEQEAYGDACLQPDGSWTQGVPKTVPSYN